jgi:hypothetical protein
MRPELARTVAPDPELARRRPPRIPLLFFLNAGSHSLLLPGGSSFAFAVGERKALGI